MEVGFDVGETLFSTLKFIEGVKETKFGTKSILRAFYIEVQQNLSFLDSITLKEGEKTLKTMDNKVLEAIIRNLNTEIASAIIYGAGAKGLGNSWRKVMKKLENANKKMKVSDKEIIENGINEKNNNEDYNLFHSIIFIIRKINFLKMVSSSPELTDVLVNLRIGVRLENIKNELSEVLAVLKEFPEIKQIIPAPKK